MERQETRTIDLAYDMIVPAYNWTMERMAAVERRIDRCLLLVSTVTIAFPVAVISIAGGNEFSGHPMSYVFGGIALALAFTSLGGLLAARQWGDIQYIVPDKLRTSEWQSLTKEEFQKYLLEDASASINADMALIVHRSRISDWMLVVFGVELAMGLVWAATELSCR